jgi:NhaP-type Na+/H+ or K+/H+ antiporter
VIALLGGAGSGLVWGWYGAGVRRPGKIWSLPSLAAAVVALVAETAAIAGAVAAAASVVAVAAGVALRLAWLSWLRRRASHGPEGGR